MPATPSSLLCDAPLLQGGEGHVEGVGWGGAGGGGTGLGEVLKGHCVAEFAKGGDGGLEVEGGDRALEDAADLVMDPRSFKRLMRGMAR